MSTDHVIPEVSPRVRLARLAWETALATKGIAGGAPGAHSQWTTGDGRELLPGVVAAANRDGSYDVELLLIVRWPVDSLHELAERIRDRIERAVERHGLAESLGQLRIAFADLLVPGERAVG